MRYCIKLGMSYVSAMTIDGHHTSSVTLTNKQEFAHLNGELATTPADADLMMISLYMFFGPKCEDPVVQRM